MMRSLADFGVLNGPATGILSFGCLFGAAIAGYAISTRGTAGTAVRAVADTVRRGTTLVSILAALMLVFVTSSLKTSFDAAEQDVRRFSFQLVEVDRSLRHGGPRAEPARELLFRYTARVMKDIWPSSHPTLRPEDLSANALLDQLEIAIDEMRGVSPTVVADARAALRECVQTRVDLDARLGGSLSPWLIGIVQFWLMLTFASLGVAAPRTPLAITALFVFSVAFGGALFLATEYDYPFDGVIRVSTESVENALFVITE
jgi:hypothetical protein